MGRILLTPSQVSVIISSTIVVLCTLALFLSGYAIQQRTLRDLRVAIRPRPSRASPKAHLPDRFKKATIKLDDGTLLELESPAEREAKGLEPIVVEVRPTMPQPPEPRRREKVEASEEKIAIVEALKAQVAEKSWAVENPDPLMKSKIPVTRAERRRMIKDELERLSQSNEPVLYQRRLW